MVPKSIQGSPNAPAGYMRSELQNSENVKSEKAPGFIDASKTSGSDAQAKAPAESKRSEGKLQADLRAADLNSQLNAQDPKPTEGKSYTGALYDMMISHFKDPKTPVAGEASSSIKDALITSVKAEGSGSIVPPPVNSLTVHEYLISNVVEPKKLEPKE